jgi:transcriptional regulator with XRE-family HTH domain
MSLEPFGAVLRRHRLGAALTQERLAERAGISAAGVAALEAGRRRAPRLSTVALIVDALQLDDVSRDELVAAATNRVPGPDVLPGIGVANELRSVDMSSEPHGFSWRYSFVGREGELERMDDAWRRRSRFLLIQGGAGVGKTRLAAEFADSLRSAGVTTLWGRCTAERLGAYEPFVDPVRSILRDRPSATVGTGELLRLVPELADRVPSRPSYADPGVERRLLFEAVATLLAGPGPTLLVIDDLHWADGASLALLAHLAADRRLTDLVVLCTVRSTDLTAFTAGSLAELRRYGALERTSLDGLPAPELARLVGQIAGRTPRRRG